MSERHTRQNNTHGQADRNHQRNPPSRGGSKQDLDTIAAYGSLFCWCGEQHGGQGKYKYAGDHPWPEFPEET